MVSRNATLPNVQELTMFFQVSNAVHRPHVVTCSAHTRYQLSHNEIIRQELHMYEYMYTKTTT